LGTGFDVPHVRCNSCGVVSYAPVNGDGAPCPECGVPYPRTRDQVVRSEEPARRLGSLVRMTRDLLDLDVALQGASIPIEDSFCRLMLEGRIGNAVPDARRQPAVAELPMVQQLGVGAYMGIPIRPGDAELYVLCCLAREARPGLGAREVKLLSGLAASVRAELQAR
jgi:GAF domain-containing protein